MRLCSESWIKHPYCVDFDDSTVVAIIVQGFPCFLWNWSISSNGNVQAMSACMIIAFFLSGVRIRGKPGTCLAGEFDHGRMQEIRLYRVVHHSLQDICSRISKLTGWNGTELVCPGWNESVAWSYQKHLAYRSQWGWSPRDLGSWRERGSDGAGSRRQRLLKGYGWGFRNEEVSTWK